MENRVKKYRLYRFCGMCSEWLCRAFGKNEMQNLEIRALTKKKKHPFGCSL